MSAQAYRDILIGYEGIGRWLLLGSILVLSGYGYVRRLRVDWLMTYAFALFLVLAPGFGVQYVAYLAPLLFAVAPRWAFAYATVSGLFIGFVYAHFQIAGYPLESRHTGQIPVPTAFVGFAAWCLVVAFLGVTLNRGSAIDGIGPATGPDAQ